MKWDIAAWREAAQRDRERLHVPTLVKCFAELIAPVTGTLTYPTQQWRRPAAAQNEPFTFPDETPRPEFSFPPFVAPTPDEASIQASRDWQDFFWRKFHPKV